MTELDALLARVATYGTDIESKRRATERKAFRMLPQLAARLAAAEAKLRQIEAIDAKMEPGKSQ